jgi:catechol-2,3-dioxygenase
LGSLAGYVQSPRTVSEDVPSVLANEETRCTMSGLGDYRAAAVLRAENLERAKKFYVDVLGLKERAVPGPAVQAMLVAGDGTAVMIYERPGMPAPMNTALGFAIPADKFDGIVADLRSKGAMFEDYDIPEMDLKTVNGVAAVGGSKAAWIKDSEGNIISIAVM